MYENNHYLQQILHDKISITRFTIPFQRKLKKIIYLRSPTSSFHSLLLHSKKKIDIISLKFVFYKRIDKPLNIYFHENICSIDINVSLS